MTQTPAKVVSPWAQPCKAPAARKVERFNFWFTLAVSDFACGHVNYLTAEAIQLAWLNVDL